MNYSLSDQALVLNKMPSVNNRSMGFYQQYHQPLLQHHNSRIPQSKHDTTMINTRHRLWESMATAALDLINIDDDFETSFPTIEWCEDGVVEQQQQQQQQQQQVDSSSSCCEIEADGFAANCHHHHHHGLVRSMRIGSRLSVLAAGPEERPCTFKRNNG
jgi:hypothetical protein